MPLRDHFHKPERFYASWEEVHGGWPTMMALQLNAILPPQYRSGLKIHLGTLVEVDVGAFEKDPQEVNGSYQNGNSEDTHPVWETTAPTLLIETEELTPAEYEVRVYNMDDARRLVAAVELVSPSNKDRPQSRKAFASKCHAMLQEEVCVVIVDTVTSLSSNLYAELADRLGANPPAIAECGIYAVSCRTWPSRKGVRVESWEYELHVDAKLPTLPLWLSEDLAVSLDLETSYMDICRGLRIQ